MNSKNPKKRVIKPDKIISLAKSDIRFVNHYPEENPETAVSDVVNTFRHIGLFDNLAE